jgi:hypothetical protein
MVAVLILLIAGAILALVATIRLDRGSWPEVAEYGKPIRANACSAAHSGASDVA